MKNTPPKTSLDFSKFVGIPYTRLDCWGLVRHYYRLVFNIHLKQYYDLAPNDQAISAEYIQKSLKDFDRIDLKEVKAGDLLVVEILGLSSHIAVCIGGGNMLHTTEGVGSTIEPISRWQRRVTGVYRLKK